MDGDLFAKEQLMVLISSNYHRLEAAASLPINSNPG
jgi:hypothetical protein